MRGPHDVGGLKAGPIDTAPHQMSRFEKEIDALSLLLGDSKRRIKVTDQNRYSIESLGHEAYHTLTYYERWTAAMCKFLVEKNVLTLDEIDAKIRQLRAKEKTPAH
jgi:hypothetical protein